MYISNIYTPRLVLILDASNLTKKLTHFSIIPHLHNSEELLRSHKLHIPYIGHISILSIKQENTTPSISHKIRLCQEQKVLKISKILDDIYLLPRFG